MATDAGENRESGMDRPMKPGMSRARFAGGALILIATAVIAVAVGVAVLVFGAYGCAKLFTRWLPFSPFEATVVSLLALVAATALAMKLLSLAIGSRSPNVSYVERCSECGRYHDTEDHEGGVEEGDLDEVFTPNDGSRAALFASGAVKPNAPCPCGSGARYRKCCGDGRLFRQRQVGNQAG
jgi:hypothetical protein